MKLIAISFAMLLSFFALGQKQLKKTLVNLESKSVQIDAKNSFKIDLSTTEGNEIVVDAKIDGEYHKDLIVKIEEDGSNVLISSGFQPNFINPNDKLSAHKVISIELKISLPKLMDVQLFGTRTNVAVEGLYRRLKIDLADGICSLFDPGENIAVKTQRGDIYLKTSSGTIDATSNYGKVIGKPLPSGNTLYTLQSVEGNIHLSKIE